MTKPTEDECPNLDKSLYRLGCQADECTCEEEGKTARDSFAVRVYAAAHQVPVEGVYEGDMGLDEVRELLAEFTSENLGDLMAARALTKVMEDEQGPVTETETAALLEKWPRPVGRCINCFHDFNTGPCGGCGAVVE